MCCFEREKVLDHLFLDDFLCHHLWLILSVVLWQNENCWLDIQAGEICDLWAK